MCKATPPRALVMSTPAWCVLLLVQVCITSLRPHPHPFMQGMSSLRAYVQWHFRNGDTVYDAERKRFGGNRDDVLEAATHATRAVERRQTVTDISLCKGGRHPAVTMEKKNIHDERRAEATWQQRPREERKTATVAKTTSHGVPAGCTHLSD